jgi:hypothetical protein
MNIEEAMKQIDRMARQIEECHSTIRRRNLEIKELEQQRVVSVNHPSVRSKFHPMEATYTFIPDAETVEASKKIVDALNKPTTDFQADLADVFAEAHALLLKKHADYGPTNISNAPGGAVNGLRVRMHDKLARISHLIDSGADAKNEPLRDSFLDLANYGIIGLMVLDGFWPGADK